MSKTSGELLQCNWRSHQFPVEELGKGWDEYDLHFCKEDWYANMADIGGHIAYRRMGSMGLMMLRFM